MTAFAAGRLTNYGNENENEYENELTLTCQAISSYLQLLIARLGQIGGTFTPTKLIVLPTIDGEFERRMPINICECFGL
jgi:hypothetical protein